MQERSTGEMFEISETMGDLIKSVPLEERPTVLQVGEVVKIKGGRFIVERIKRKKIMLRGLPALQTEETTE